MSRHYFNLCKPTEFRNSDTLYPVISSHDQNLIFVLARGAAFEMDALTAQRFRSYWSKGSWHRDRKEIETVA